MIWCDSMEKVRKILIIEALPKKENIKESMILKNLFKMINNDMGKVVKYQIKPVTGKNEFLDYLYSKSTRDLDEFEIIHFACHGDSSSGMTLPKGSISPNDLKDHDLWNTAISFSSCELGRKSFANDIISNTGAKFVIGPNRIISYSDASLWFINFYYELFYKNRTIKTAYTHTKETLAGRVGGGFTLTERSKIMK
jgi:hypothetical protein